MVLNCEEVMVDKSETRNPKPEGNPNPEGRRVARCRGREAFGVRRLFTPLSLWSTCLPPGPSVGYAACRTKAALKDAALQTLARPKFLPGLASRLRDWSAALPSFKFWISGALEVLE